MSPFRTRAASAFLVATLVAGVGHAQDTSITRLFRPAEFGLPASGLEVHLAAAGDGTVAFSGSGGGASASLVQYSDGFRFINNFGSHTVLDVKAAEGVGGFMVAGAEGLNFVSVGVTVSGMAINEKRQRQPGAKFHRTSNGSKIVTFASVETEGVTATRFVQSDQTGGNAQPLGASIESLPGVSRVVGFGERPQIAARDWDGDGTADRLAIPVTIETPSGNSEQSIVVVDASVSGSAADPVRLYGRSSNLLYQTIRDVVVNPDAIAFTGTTDGGVQVIAQATLDPASGAVLGVESLLLPNQGINAPYRLASLGEFGAILISPESQQIFRLGANASGGLNMSDQALTHLLGVGDVLDGFTITRLHVDPSAVTLTGDVTFYAELSDGTSGVYRMSNVPAPSTALAVAGGLLVAQRRRRR
jgi:hypothetical protein